MEGALPVWRSTCGGTEPIRGPLWTRRPRNGRVISTGYHNMRRTRQRRSPPDWHKGRESDPTSSCPGLLGTDVCFVVRGEAGQRPAGFGRSGPSER